MSDDIKVREAGSGLDHLVVTDEIGERHWPLFKMAYGDDGEAILVSASNSLPITDASNLLVMQNFTASLNDLITEQKLTNLYLSRIVGEDLRIDNELENR